MKGEGEASEKFEADAARKKNIMRPVPNKHAYEMGERASGKLSYRIRNVHPRVAFTNG